MALKKYLTWNFLLVVLIQYVGFKLSWLAAAYGAVEGPPWSYYGAIPFLVWLAIHVAYYRKFWELWYALSVGLMGTIIDTCYASTGFIVYNGPYPVLDFLAPMWITAIWMGLAITLDHSLDILIGKPIWTYFVGAIFGPLAYWSGDGMGGLHFQMAFWPTMAILAFVWGFAFMACYGLLAYWRPKDEQEVPG